MNVREIRPVAGKGQILILPDPEPDGNDKNAEGYWRPNWVFGRDPLNTRFINAVVSTIISNAKV